MLLPPTLAGAATSELQWRRGGPSNARASAAFDSPYRRDLAVRQAAFDDERTPGEARVRSVVVKEPTDEPVRSAQLQWGQPSAPQPDNRYEDPSRTPFGADQPAADDDLFGPSDEELDAELDEEIETLPPAELPDEELRAPSADEIPLPEDSDVEIKERQLREEPNVAEPESFQPDGTSEPALGPPGTEAFGEEQRELDLPDADVGPQTLEQMEDDAQQDCETALERLRARRLSDVNLNIAVSGTQGEDFPYECSVDNGEWYAGRCWCETTYMWKASALCHKPLYFEDEALERYGHSWGPCLDPFVSGAHFFCKLPVLPYCMGVQPPNECVYALGHYRPGNCAPYMINPVPLSCRGGLFQAGAVVGAAAALP